MELREHLAHLRAQVASHQHRLARPLLGAERETVHPYIERSAHPEPIDAEIEWDGEPDAPTFRAIKVDLHPDARQAEILRRWCLAYRKMYNATIAFIKRQYYETRSVTLNYQRLRTYHLRDERDAIIEASSDNRRERVKTHMLDEAIKLACANYKSAIANLRNGHIRHFRIRYWRTNRVLFRLDVETSFIKESGICPSVLGPLAAAYDGEPYDWSAIRHTAQVQYNRVDNRFYLYVPIVAEREVPVDRQPWVSLDPGSRRFMTGLSERESLFIGEGVASQIKDRLQRKDRLRAHPTLSDKKKKRAIDHQQRKIRGVVENLHWQTANYLTTRYETVLIGDLSAKGVSSRKRKGVRLAPMSKRILQALAFFQFRQRLMYKASVRGSTVRVVPEAYTSKVCSCCGHVNATLGASHVFACPNCGVVMDRDLNGARGICLKEI